MPYLTPLSTPSAYICRRLFIPDETQWLGVINGALIELTNNWNWEQVDGISVSEAVNEVHKMLSRYWDEDCTSMIGAVILYATNSAPTNTLLCDGSIYLREDYPSLYAVLADDYKIDADTFRTPNPVSYVGLNFFIVAA
jgi:hypothetical protein